MIRQLAITDHRAADWRAVADKPGRATRRVALYRVTLSAATITRFDGPGQRTSQPKPLVRWAVCTTNAVGSDRQLVRMFERPCDARAAYRRLGA